MAFSEFTERILTALKDNTLPTDLLVKKGNRIRGIKQKLTVLQNYHLIDINKDGISLTEKGEEIRDRLKQNM